MKPTATIIALTCLLVACGPSGERRQTTEQPRQSVTVSQQDREIIRALVECGQFYATLAGIGSRARDPRMSEGARDLSNRFGELAGSHARARGIPFATFKRISDNAEASIRRQRRDINVLFDTYGDYCRDLGQANGLI